jgi:hypothetical protein
VHPHTWLKNICKAVVMNLWLVSLACHLCCKYIF